MVGCMVLSSPPAPSMLAGDFSLALRVVTETSAPLTVGLHFAVAFKTL